MSHFHWLKGSLWIFVVLGLLSFNVNASQVSIKITAVVDSVDDWGELLGGAINPGDFVIGHYIYDTSTPDTNSLPSVGDYWHTTAGQGICLMVNGKRFHSDRQNPEFLVELVNNHGSSGDNYLVRSYQNTFAISAPEAPWGTGYVNNHIGWQLDDPSGHALSGVQLPATPPALANWQSWAGLTIESQGYMNMFHIRAHVVSVELGTSECSFDPEPVEEKDRFIDVTSLEVGPVGNVREAVLSENTQGAYTIAVKHLMTGGLVNQINLVPQNTSPIGLVGIRDINNNNTPEVAVLYPHIGNRAAVLIVDSASGQVIRNIPVGNQESKAIGIALLPDLNYNGSNELSILSELPDGNGFTQVFDSRTGQQLFGNNYD